MAISTFAAEQKAFHTYNWSDCAALDTMANSKKGIGIKAIYDAFDSNGILGGKLMAGSVDSDLIMPSVDFLECQLIAGVSQSLNGNGLPEWKNLGPELLKLVARHDSDNKSAIPHVQATAGTGYNVGKVGAVLGESVSVDSWDLILRPENLEKLKNCGIPSLDAPREVLTAVLNYLGKDPNSTRAGGCTGPTTGLLLKLRPNIRCFHSS